MSISDASGIINQPANMAAFSAVHWWQGVGGELETHSIGRDAEGFLRPHLDPQTGKWHLGLEWAEPRDVRKVVVRFADPSRILGDPQVQYWRHNWPTPAPERWPGARRGWIGRDDPWNGHWVAVKAERRNDGATYTFEFEPVDIPELKAGIETMMAAMPSAMRHGLRSQAAAIPAVLEQAEHYLARFRRTLKIRVYGSADGGPPTITDVEVYTCAIWREREL